LKNKEFFRVIDANQNRAREGLRVVEDITRFILNNKDTSQALKRTRQAITKNTKLLVPERQKLLFSRDSVKDVGRSSGAEVLKRKNYQEILEVNLKRAQESTRVLEEFSKLKSESVSCAFQKIRFKLYGLEKKVLNR